MYKTGIFGSYPGTQTEVAEKFQIFDLLQLSRREREAKELCLQRLADLHDWEKDLPKHISVAAFSTVRIRSATLRRQAREAIKIYKLIRGSRTKIFKTYMDELPVVGASKRLAS
jgi:hypothetical protein